MGTQTDGSGNTLYLGSSCNVASLSFSTIDWPISTNNSHPPFYIHTPVQSPTPSSLTPSPLLPTSRVSRVIANDNDSGELSPSLPPAMLPPSALQLLHSRWWGLVICYSLKVMLYNLRPALARLIKLRPMRFGQH